MVVILVTPDTMSNTTSELFASNTTTRLGLGNATSITSQNVTGNMSVPEGCLVVRLEEMEFLPWDNPDNIVSAEVEHIARRVKDNLLFFLFLIGGPANVINLAVFYKQGLKERVNLCLFALSLADEIFLTQSMFFFGEQIHLQFTTKEIFGPMMRFMVNNNLVGFFGFSWVSEVLSAIIASERCLCVLSPLRSQTLLRTRTMAVIIVVVFLVVVGFYFVMATRYRIACIFVPPTGTTFYAGVASEFYRKHETFINYLEGFLYGAGIPLVVITVVVTNDDNNSDKNSPGRSVESRDLFSKRLFVVVVVVVIDLSPGVGADQDVDRHRGVVHCVCFPPRPVQPCVALSAGDEHWTSVP